jgi:hypothetical protein
MYCPKCGKENAEGASFCQSCGADFSVPAPGAMPSPPPYQGAPVQPGQVPHVPNYLVWSIICIFLCWLLAIPAIVNAVRVDSLLAVGDVAGARAASSRAKGWAIAATVVGVVGAIFVGIIRATM